MSTLSPTQLGFIAAADYFAAKYFSAHEDDPHQRFTGNDVTMFIDMEVAELSAEEIDEIVHEFTQQIEDLDKVIDELVERNAAMQGETE